jgi:O-antigen/teichoic acid export membrane protein
MITKFRALQNHAGFIRYFKNTSWMMAEHFLRIISGFFVGVWVARYLGPEQFGLLSYVVAFTAIFGSIAKLGLDSVIVRELVNHPEQRDIYLGTAFRLKVLGAFIVMSVMVAIVPFTSNDGRTNLFIFIIAAGLIFQSFEVVEFYFQSQVRAKIVSTCKVIQLSLSSLIKIYLVLTEAELICFVLIVVFDAFALAVSYAIAYKISKNRIFYKYFDPNIAKQLLKASWPLIFAAFFALIYMRIDQIMIKEMLGEYEVGIYSAAIRLGEAFYFIPMLITISLFPAIVKAKQQGEELYKQRLQQLYNLMFWLAFVIALLMSFLSDRLIVLLFGTPYHEAGQILMVHVWASIFVFWGVASQRWLFVENLQILTLISTASGAVVNLLLNYTLIPVFGVMGAAYATLISYAVAGYFMYFMFAKSRENFYMMSNSIFLLRKRK